MSILGFLPDSMPGDRVTIIDNSGYSESMDTPLIDPIALMAFISPVGVGPDNKVVEIRSKNVGDYGIPNYKKWGVSLYNVNQYIKGGGNVLGVRCMPANSTLANLAICAKYKTETDVQYTDGEGNPLYKDAQGIITTVSTNNTAMVRDILKVVLTTQSFSTIHATSVPVLETAFDELATKVVDADGYLVAPLFMVYERSAGLFGNGVAVRVSFDPAMESEIDGGRFYSLSAIDTANPIANFCDNVSFAFDEDFVYADALYGPDAFDTYNRNLGMYYSKSLDAFKAVVSTLGVNKDAGELSVNDIDILFGLERGGDTHYKYVIDPTSVSISAVNGLALAGGSDGDFDLSNTSRATKMSEAMAYVYNGHLTDLIYDELRYPFIHCFDSDDSLAVKTAVNNLCNKRYTSIGILSAPPNITTYTQIDALRKFSYTYDSFSTVFYTESGLVTDPYSLKKVRMPASYFNAYEMANHCKAKGFGIPFAGKFFKWTGFKAGSLLPQSTSLETLKNEHKLRLNQMQEDGKGTATPYQQITMQSGMSKLSELNNVHILKIMVRYALIVAEDSRWNFNEDDDVVKFEKAAKDKIDLKLNGLYSKFEINCKRMSANGAGANRILAVIHVTFKNILKGVDYQFYIN